MPAKHVARPPALEPAHPAPSAHPAPPPIVRGNEGVGALMIASLPTQASGADVYARQFYRGSQVPFRRYLPVTLR
jgi:hypothetical protein